MDSPYILFGRYKTVGEAMGMFHWGNGGVLRGGLGDGLFEFSGEGVFGVEFECGFD